MLKTIFTKLFGIKNKDARGSKKGKDTDNTENANAQKSSEKRPLTENLEDNIQALREIFDLCADVVYREFKINTQQPLKAALIYIEGLTNVTMVNNNLLEPLLHPTSSTLQQLSGTTDHVMQFLQENVIGIAEVLVTDDLIQVTTALASADAVLILENSKQALLLSVAGEENRAITEPDTEPNIRGPKDGFVESLYVNLSLIRRRIRSSRFKVEIFEIGAFSKTKIAVCYLKGIANDKIVGEVKARIQQIKIDGMLASGYLEEFIADEKFALFPLVQTTERPDRTAASIFEGRIAIIVDNTPSTLIVPCTFNTLMQAAEDYYITAPFATFVRLLRFVGLNIALLLPALTVAAFSYHQELIPMALLNTVAGARQELPFPIFMELVFMELTFELLREAGLRLPKTVGQAISTVGGLVIGDAAVTAGFVSPLSVIVVALTAVASFTNPNYAAGTSIRILRFFLLILAATLGGVGIMMGLMVILIHLSSLRSFGVPYLSPFAPLSPADLKDTFIRAPWWAMLNRPRLFGSREPQRQDSSQGPTKPDKGGE